ncbi:MAG: hypothetical protein ACLTKT_04525 [Clostridia bacterium]|nr:hypothetical protein [Clostridium sp.]MBS6251815.1 hypothetical protein [Clostridium sp.]
MKKIGFIGAYDKTDLLLNLAKILTVMNNRVLIIDSSLMQKAKYVVPVINPTVTYITTFEDFDVAVGFNSLKQIKGYLGYSENEDLPYDIVLVDSDTEESIENFELINAEKNYFVTAFDLYSLKKGLEILSGLREPMALTKILFSKDMTKEEDDYLNFLSLGYKVLWNDYRIYFILNDEDTNSLIENQRASKIRFKKLSSQYKDSLIYIVQEILKDTSESNIRKVVKIIERGV